MSSEDNVKQLFNNFFEDVKTLSMHLDTFEPWNTAINQTKKIRIDEDLFLPLEHIQANPNTKVLEKTIRTLHNSISTIAAFLTTTKLQSNDSAIIDKCDEIGQLNAKIYDTLFKDISPILQGHADMAAPQQATQANVKTTGLLNAVSNILNQIERKVVGEFTTLHLKAHDFHKAFKGVDHAETGQLAKEFYDNIVDPLEDRATFGKEYPIKNKQHNSMLETLNKTLIFINKLEENHPLKQDLLKKLNNVSEGFSARRNSFLADIKRTGEVVGGIIV